MKRKIAQAIENFKAVFEDRKPSKKALPKIAVTLFIKPICYVDSEIFSAVELVSDADKKRKKALKFYDDPLWARTVIKGSLSGPGEELELPIKHEYERFLDDCEFVIKNRGFKILERRQSIDSKKAACCFALGVDHTPCGTFVFDFCVSKHSLDKYKLPKAWRNAASDCLEMHKILGDDFRKYGIDFMVDKVIIGRTAYASWDQALGHPLWDSFDRLRRKVKKRLKQQK